MLLNKETKLKQECGYNSVGISCCMCLDGKAIIGESSIWVV